MSAHTPGPWRIVGVDGYATGIWGAKAETVVDCAPMRQEDARLIAAAPELLAGLVDMFALMDEGVLVRNIAQDGDPMWAVKAMSIVARLRAAQIATQKAVSP